jgi:Holliday junction resolvase-like predicted endonuclease
LRARGALVVARNLRLWPGEIDLLVLLGGRLVAVEVKSRWLDDPADEFTREKSARLQRFGARLRPAPHRYDLVTVRFGRRGADVRWIPGVC